MRVKHGISVPLDMILEMQDKIEYWWAGEKVSQGEFNKRSIEQMRSMDEGADVFHDGLEILKKAGQAEAELALLEKILKGPLCEVCRMMIENMKP